METIAPTKNTLFGVVYKPPDVPDHAIHEDLLNGLTSKYPECIIYDGEFIKKLRSNPSRVLKIFFSGILLIVYPINLAFITCCNPSLMGLFNLNKCSNV